MHDKQSPIDITQECLHPKVIKVFGFHYQIGPNEALKWEIAPALQGYHHVDPSLQTLFTLLPRVHVQRSHPGIALGVKSSTYSTSFNIWEWCC